MATEGVAQKLRIAGDSALLLLNAPEGYAQLLGALPGGVRIAPEPVGQQHVVLLLVRDRAKLERSLRQATEAVRGGGILWIAWEKKARRGPNDLNRDTLWAAVQPSGWGPVTNVAIDAMWSALRFKPGAEIARRAMSVKRERTWLETFARMWHNSCHGQMLIFSSDVRLSSRGWGCC